MSDLKTKILSRIHGKGRGAVYASKDFLDLGTRAGVDQALSRLVKAGEIRRIGRGLFDYPRVNSKLGGELSPDSELVAQAVARRQGGRISPSGAHAANALGLSTQVPGRRVYVTNSSGGSVQVGKQTITFKRVTPKRVSAKHEVSNTVFQAFQHLGRDGVTADVISHLQASLSEGDKKILLKESRYAAGWISDLIKQVVQD
jgi:hypothetical protein